MTSYDNKYGFKDNKKAQLFHKSRRMFCIKDNKLYIAAANLNYTHAVWFEKEGWITQENDSLVSEITRGFVDSLGNVHFYVGFDMRITKKAFQETIKHLPELIETLNLNKEKIVYGGRGKNKDGKFEPTKSYGKIRELL